MQEHAIPQDITGYKFHIVGNMTLKQFAEVALGVILAFFFYKTNLAGIIKWPLVLFSGSFGAALAFLPMGERPLDHWFVTFFTILYKPTKFYWKKEPHIPEAFLYKKPKNETKNKKTTLDLTPQRRQRIVEFLKSVKKPQVLSQEDLAAKQRSNQLLAIFKDESLRTNLNQSKNFNKKPNLRIRIRSLVDIGGGQTADASQSSTETVIFNNLGTRQRSVSQPRAGSSGQKNFMAKKSLRIDQVAREIKIPKLNKVEVKKSTLKNDQKSVSKTATKTQAAAFSTLTRQPISKSQTAIMATQNASLPFPTKPTEENKLVGMILTKNNELIDGATVTISDQDNRPVTAVKSNALGQFFISSKLNNGEYTINIKRNNFSFQPIKITLSGKVVEPLDIRSNQ